MTGVQVPAITTIFLGFPHRGKPTTAPYLSCHPETNNWPVGEVRTLSEEAAATLACHASDLPSWGSLAGTVGFSTPSQAQKKRSTAKRRKRQAEAGSHTDGSRS